ncbi:hypothetical protein [Pedobacter sp.]
MNNRIKALMPALALTAILGGTFIANAMERKNNDIDLTYYGVRSNGQRVLLDNPPSSSDCDGTNKICYLTVDEEQNEAPFGGGAYIGQ